MAQEASTESEEARIGKRPEQAFHEQLQTALRYSSNLAKPAQPMKVTALTKPPRRAKLAEDLLKKKNAMPSCKKNLPAGDSAISRSASVILPKNSIASPSAGMTTSLMRSAKF